jgi:hypothetical protein
VSAPYFAYDDEIVPGESCPDGSSSISGLAFYEGGSYPAEYGDALFFTDYSRECIWVMFAGANGFPDPASVQVLDVLDVGPVDLEIGPRATSSTRTSMRTRFAGSASSARTSPHGGRAGEPDQRPRSADGEL